MKLGITGPIYDARNLNNQLRRLGFCLHYQREGWHIIAIADLPPWLQNRNTFDSSALLCQHATSREKKGD